MTPKLLSQYIWQEHPDFHEKAPLLHMAVMLGKEPPFQDTVCQLYYLMGEPSELKQQCKLLVTAAAKRCAEDRRTDTANLCVNALALGYLSTLLYWGVLIKITPKKNGTTDDDSKTTRSDPRRPSKTSATDNFKFRSGGVIYQAAPWSPQLLDKLNRVARAAEALNQACVNVPRTLVAYSEAAHALERSGELKFPGAATSKYVRPWVVRTRLVTEMRMRGVRQLKFSHDAPLSLLARGFPDHKAPGIRGLCSSLRVSIRFRGLHSSPRVPREVERALVHTDSAGLGGALRAGLQGQDRWRALRAPKI